LRKVVAAKPRSGNDIDGIALRIVREFQPDALENLQNFKIEEFFEFELESLVGVKSDYRNLQAGILGYIDSDSMMAVIASDLMDDQYAEYYRNSTIAHETGHAIMHVPEFKRKKAAIRSITNEDNVKLLLYRESDIPVYRNPEWQAWRFAGALLIPEPAIKQALRMKYSVQKMSDVFRVNPAFVRARMKALKLI